MKALLVCTHGSSAKELVNSAEMICGKQENQTSVAFTMGESPDKLEQELKKKISTLDLSDGILCLTDLKGGTPFNTLVHLTQSIPQLHILTGVSIPMLLEFFIQREQYKMPDLIESTIKAAHDGIYQYVFTENTTDNEEF